MENITFSFNTVVGLLGGVAGLCVIIFNRAVSDIRELKAWQITQDERLFPNLTNAGSSSEGIDFISNGLKLRGTSSNWNDAGGIYSYMAFAEAPLVGTNGVTAKGR